jgi:hypothetical protein
MDLGRRSGYRNRAEWSSSLDYDTSRIFFVLVLLVVLLPVPTANNVHFSVFFLFRKLENEAADMEASRRPNNPAAGS